MAWKPLKRAEYAIKRADPNRPVVLNASKSRAKTGNGYNYSINFNRQWLEANGLADREAVLFLYDADSQRLACEFYRQVPPQGTLLFLPKRKRQRTNSYITAYNTTTGRQMLELGFKINTQYELHRDPDNEAVWVITGVEDDD